MDKIRVVHYINQFFAGVGGEGKASTPPAVKKGAAGPGQMLESLLSPRGEVVATVYCGDNYINENREVGQKKILKMISEYHPQVVIAGPAFSSGRYGLACASVCDAIQEKLGIPALTGMHKDNPGADDYRARVYIVSTGLRAIAMREAMSVMARVAIKLASGEHMGAASDEGYLPTGRRRNELTTSSGAERALDMLVKKLRRESFVTEWPLPKYDIVHPASPVPDLRKATVALVTEGGCIPKGNPDRIESSWATKWMKYDIRGLDSLSSDKYECIHGGFDTTLVNEDPNRMVPLDAMVEIEKRGFIGKSYDFYYVTVGSMGSISNIKKFGAEIAKNLKAHNVDAAIVTAT